MNIKHVMLFFGLSFFTGMALAGTVTIKSPPPGLTLKTTSGVIKYGDPDMVLTSAQEVININISPEAENKIIGMETISHWPKPVGALSNQNTCRINKEFIGFSVTIDLVGYKMVTCNPGENKQNNQLATDGIADVVVTYNKLPATN